MTEQQTALYEFVTTTTPGVRFPLIADSWQALVSYDLNTPGEALPIGGYSRSAPTTSPREFLRLIRSHEARYFLLTRDPRTFGNLGAAPVARYVQHHCSLLHPANGAPSLTAHGSRLYDCWQLRTPGAGRLGAAIGRGPRTGSAARPESRVRHTPSARPVRHA